MLISAQQIAQYSKGTVLQDAQGSRFQFDSRLIQSGEWFVVLQGARDGHDFLDKATQQGCAGAIGQRMPANWSGGFVQVDDSLQAFQDVAHALRQEFTGIVVGITGSAGKTTTRALTASVLSEGGGVHQTQGNFNNHIGVPKTITDADGDEYAWVLEMGMSALREIHVLQEIGTPNIRLITNVGAAHVEGCGSIEGVAQAKGELFDGARPGDTCCVNIDDPFVRSHPIPNGVNTITFGQSESADVRLVAHHLNGWQTHMTIQTPKGTFSSHLNVPGHFMALNACAATAVGIAADLSLEQIARGLQQYTPVGMRMKVVELDGCTVINDAYNANPLSMIAALDTLHQMNATQKIAMLGDMLEMGEVEQASHQEVLEHALSLKLDLVLVGPRFKQAWHTLESNVTSNVQCFDSSDDAGRSLTFPTSDGIVLLKGSRGIKMERILEAHKNMETSS
jgi:UDP-N-acetylmuramoyl-tripeptide--D-alanyl-D-alanine ligase